MDFNLIQHGLAVQAAIVEANNNVVPFPTAEQAKKLHAQGKVIVARPVKAGELQAFNPDDFPPEAA
jgi:hypothetical protein